MKKKKILKKLNYQPTKLQVDAIKNPFVVMHDFFADYPIEETRDKVWELYKSWIYHSSQYADQELTKDMLCFFTQLKEFLDASYLYTQMKK